MFTKQALVEVELVFVLEGVHPVCGYIGLFYAFSSLWIVFDEFSSMNVAFGIYLPENGCTTSKML